MAVCDAEREVLWQEFIHKISFEMKDDSGILSKFKKLSEESVIKESEVDEYLAMVSKRMVIVPFLGEGSSGKSTLINALLGDKYLPSSCPKETLTRTYIVHNGSEDEPRLYSSLDRSDDKLLTRGVDNIFEKIKEYNNPNNRNVPEVLVISANIPMFKNVQVSPLTLYLMDCPGLEYLKEDTNSLETIVSEVVYVHNYRRFLQDPDKIKNDLIGKPKCAKLLFVVTQFDAYFESDREDNPNEHEVKKRTAEMFSEFIKEDRVYIVSGKWALSSRIRNPNAATELSLRQAFECIQLNHPTTGDQEAVVLRFSNITALEKGIRDAIEAIDWTNQVTSKFQNILQEFENAANASLASAVSQKKVLAEKILGTSEKLKKIEQDKEFLCKMSREIQVKSEFCGMQEDLCETVTSKLKDDASQVFRNFSSLTEIAPQQVAKAFQDFKSTIPITLKSESENFAHKFLVEKRSAMVHSCEDIFSAVGKLENRGLLYNESDGLQVDRAGDREILPFEISSVWSLLSWKTILPGWRVLLLPLLAIIFFVPILPIIKLLAVLKYGFLLKSTIFGLLYGASEVTLGGFAFLLFARNLRPSDLNFLRQHLIETISKRRPIILEMCGSEIESYSNDVVSKVISKARALLQKITDVDNVVRRYKSQLAKNKKDIEELKKRILNLELFIKHLKNLEAWLNNLRLKVEN